MLDATKPQDGVNGTAEGIHSAEGADSGRATGSEVLFPFPVPLSRATARVITRGVCWIMTMLQQFYYSKIQHKF